MTAATTTMTAPSTTSLDDAVGACLTSILVAKAAGRDRLSSAEVRSLVNDARIALGGSTGLPRPLQQLLDEAKRRMNAPFLRDFTLSFGLKGLEDTLNRLYSVI